VFCALEVLANRKHHATALLIGLQADPAYSMEGELVAGIWGQILKQAREDFEKEKQALETRCRMEPAFSLHTRSLLISASLAGGEAAVQARHSDLAVLQRPAGAKPEFYRDNIFEAVLFGSGRPVLLIPPKWRGNAIGRNILVGWNGKREAARAIGDAMPMLESADSVTVVTVDAMPSHDGWGDAPGVDITAHLARHGVNARLRNIDGLGRDEGDALLAEALAQDADLIVIGGYGKARFQEWIFGGVTRSVTQTSDIPVLLSH